MEVGKGKGHVFFPSFVFWGEVGREREMGRDIYYKL